MGGILKGSDDGIYHCEQLVCWALSIVFNVNKICNVNYKKIYKNLKFITFRKMALLPEEEPSSET